MSYKSVIDSFDVENNPKYQKASNGDTYCNIFAQDVMNAMGEPLPTGRCVNMYNALAAKQYPHWKPVGSLQAQERAKAGYGTIGITTDHVVVIYPTTATVTTRNNIHMSMAGTICYNDMRITLAWKAAYLNDIKYYSYFPSTSETIVAIDTTSDVTKSNGGTYIFETKSAQTPTVTVGSSGVVTLTHNSRDSINGYDLWKLAYVGTSGSAAGIYTAAPGESALKRFVARVA